MDIAVEEQHDGLERNGEEMNPEDNQEIVPNRQPEQKLTYKSFKYVIGNQSAISFIQL